jgi:hypothetical protein
LLNAPGIFLQFALVVHSNKRGTMLNANELPAVVTSGRTNYPGDPALGDLTQLPGT